MPIDRERLREEMARQHISQATLAAAVGVSAASIQQILNGSVRNPRSLRQIAKTLGVSQDWLEGLSEEPARQFAIDIAQDDFDPVPLQYFTKDFEDLHNPSAKVGTRIVVFSHSWLRSIVPSHLRDGVELMLFRFSGREMAPTILPGDDILIASATEFDGDFGSIWMLGQGEKMLFRRVTAFSNGVLSLDADNPSTPSLQTSTEKVKFLAKVIWQGRSLLP